MYHVVKLQVFFKLCANILVCINLIKFFGHNESINIYFSYKVDFLENLWFLGTQRVIIGVNTPFQLCIFVQLYGNFKSTYNVKIFNLVVMW